MTWKRSRPWAWPRPSPSRPLARYPLPHRCRNRPARRPLPLARSSCTWELLPAREFPHNGTPPHDECYIEPHLALGVETRAPSLSDPPRPTRALEPSRERRPHRDRPPARRAPRAPRGGGARAGTRRARRPAHPGRVRARPWGRPPPPRRGRGAGGAAPGVRLLARLRARLRGGPVLRCRSRGAARARRADAARGRAPPALDRRTAHARRGVPVPGSPRRALGRRARGLAFGDRAPPRHRPGG